MQRLCRGARIAQSTVPGMRAMRDSPGMANDQARGDGPRPIVQGVVTLHEHARARYGRAARRALADVRSMAHMRRKPSPAHQRSSRPSSPSIRIAPRRTCPVRSFIRGCPGLHTRRACAQRPQPGNEHDAGSAHRSQARGFWGTSTPASSSTSFDRTRVRGREQGRGVGAALRRAQRDADVVGLLERWLPKYADYPSAFQDEAGRLCAAGLGSTTSYQLDDRRAEPARYGTGTVRSHIARWVAGCAHSAPTPGPRDGDGCASLACVRTF